MRIPMKDTWTESDWFSRSILILYALCTAAAVARGFELWPVVGVGISFMTYRWDSMRSRVEIRRLKEALQVEKIADLRAMQHRDR